MIPELGQLALILALLLAGLQVLLPAAGFWKNDARLIASAPFLAFGQAFFVLLAFAILTIAFLLQDFSVLYVAQNSNLGLPWYYRFSAVWGAHEGSLLLWIAILNLWAVWVAVKSAALPRAFMAKVLAVLGFIGLGFLLFVLFTSNPFARALPAWPDGNDLNPLLQDPGLIIHPPMLYTGYVGFAVSFAFAIAALLEKNVDRDWIRWCRPWTLFAWSFLTLGIALGSWWAYYELGWGGWWFWDPVENASFMPWLIGTALIHSQAVTDKRGAFGNWTLILAILAFSLSLLGTFLVRSGVLTSVHAFASDPTRGLFILIYLGVVIGGALSLYAVQAPRMARSETAFSWLSRESFILVNNLLLTSAAAMILLGTLYPLLADALDLGDVSVGPPYFGLLFLMFMTPLIALLPLGPLSQWRSANLGLQRKRLLQIWAGMSIATALLVFYLANQEYDLAKTAKTSAALLALLWVGLGSLAYLHRMARARGTIGNAERWGAGLAHLGVAIFCFGALATEALSMEKDLRLEPGQSAAFGDYRIAFSKLERLDGPNYKAHQATFEITRNGKKISQLTPQKRYYASGNQAMTEADIDAGVVQDIYIALGEPLDQGKAWSLRIYRKPFVRWIWLGALCMTLGGFIAASDARYRRRSAPSNAEAASA